jgi:phosphate starvation-inducible protein PhoH
MSKTNRNRKVDSRVSHYDHHTERVERGNIQVGTDRNIASQNYWLDSFHPIGGQKDVVQSMINNPLTIVNGRAGTGKTATAIWKGLSMLKDGSYKHLVFIKTPAEYGDDAIGFLTGDAQTKLVSHFEVTKGVFSDFMSVPKIEDEIKRGRIKLLIPNFLLGATIKDSIIIIDEAQTISPKTLELILTRTHESSRVVLLGDVRQDNAYYQRPNGLADLIGRITEEDSEGRYSVEPLIGYIELGSNMNQRGDLSKRIVEIYGG